MGVSLGSLGRHYKGRYMKGRYCRGGIVEGYCRGGIWVIGCFFTTPKVDSPIRIRYSLFCVCVIMSLGILGRHFRGSTLGGRYFG